MSPSMMQASSSLLVTLADAAARSFLLACLAALFLAAFRVESVRIKLQVWRAVLFAALAMPFVVSLSPALPVAIPVPDLPFGSAPAEGPEAMATRVAAPVTTPAPASDAGHPAPLQGEAAPTTRNPLRGRAMPWPVFGIGAYAAIALVLLARLLIGIRFGKRLERPATPIDDPRAVEILSGASRLATLGRIPRLAESRMLSVPLLLGVRNPVVLLPASWHSWDDGELAAVLAHELSHIGRHDALMQRLALIHRAMFWFSPLAWWLDHHLAELSEQASDEAALAGGADRTRYAETLLGFFAALEASRTRVWWHGVAMAKTGQAEKRVERILAWRRTMSSRLTKALVVGLAIGALPVIALTSTLEPSFYALPHPVLPQAPPPPGPPDGTVLAPNPIPEPDPVIVLPPVAAPARPISPSQQPAPPVGPAPEAPAPPRFPSGGSGGNWNWITQVYWPWGSRFVIVTPGSEPWTMSGSEEDMQHARSLREKISGDFIWFERDEKSYVIRDPATIDRAKKIWALVHDSVQQQQELQKKEEELGRQMSEGVQQKIDDVRVKIPDLTAQLHKLEDEVRNLNASGATLQQLGDLQREVGELQRALGESQWQGGAQLRDMGHQAGELGRQMGDLGRQIGALARHQVELGRAAAEQMQELLDDAIAKGTARSE